MASCRNRGFLAMPLTAIPIRGISEISSGDDLASLILGALRRQRLSLRRGDIIVIKHKVISKAEGRIVKLTAVRPSPRARRWARQNRLDARAAHLAFAESRRVVRQRRGILITETRHGLVCANSGVDLSNVDGGDSAVLLPTNPDRSALALHRALSRATRLRIPVIISDSFARPWREGLCEAAIGMAGITPSLEYPGRRAAERY